MRKTYNIEPIDEIALVYKDEEIILRFDTRAIFKLQTEFDVKEILTNPSITDLCATLIYCASADLNKDMTLDKAKELVCQMDVSTITGIVEDFEKSVGVTKNGEMKELQKKTMEQFVTNLCKKK